MIEVLKERPDLFAMLDVTSTEPPNKGSILYELPNIMLTPHIAGGMGNECGRLGCYIADELKRYLNNQKMLGEINNAEQIKLKA
jgi:phosphoglycerate dehydrogenase-like enzyme